MGHQKLEHSFNAQYHINFSVTQETIHQIKMLTCWYLDFHYKIFCMIFCTIFYRT